MFITDYSSLYASLNSSATTPEAQTLVASLARDLELGERTTGRRKYARRGEKLAEFEFAVGAFLADLLRAAVSDKHAGWVGRSKKKDTFTGEVVSYRAFKALTDALIAAEHVIHEQGYQRWAEGWDGPEGPHIVTEARAACFKATDC